MTFSQREFYLQFFSSSIFKGHRTRWPEKTETTCKYNKYNERKWIYLSRTYRTQIRYVIKLLLFDIILSYSPNIIMKRCGGANTHNMEIGHWATAIYHKKYLKLKLDDADKKVIRKWKLLLGHLSCCIGTFQNSKFHLYLCLANGIVANGNFVVFLQTIIIFRLWAIK